MFKKARGTFVTTAHLTLLAACGAGETGSTFQLEGDGLQAPEPQKVGEAELASPSGDATPTPPVPTLLAELETPSGSRVEFFRVVDDSKPEKWLISMGETLKPGQTGVVDSLRDAGASPLEVFLTLSPEGTPSQWFFEHHERYVQHIGRRDNDVRDFSDSLRVEQYRGKQRSDVCRTHFFFRMWAEGISHPWQEPNRDVLADADVLQGNGSIRARTASAWARAYVCNFGPGGLNDRVEFRFLQNQLPSAIKRLADGESHIHYYDTIGGKVRVSGITRAGRTAKMMAISVP